MKNKYFNDWASIVVIVVTVFYLVVGVVGGLLYINDRHHGVVKCLSPLFENGEDTHMSFIVDCPPGKTGILLIRN